MRIDRMIEIHRQIKKGNYPSTNKLRKILMEKYDLKTLGTATISRDVEFLKSRWNAPIEYDVHKKGYYYPLDFELKF